MKPWSGVIGEDGVEVQRIYSVDAATGAGTWITPATLHAYEFGYSPNSKEIAFTAANPPGENNWWISQLYTVATDGSATPKVAFDPNTTSTALHGLQIAVPRFSPDGKRIAFIGGLMSDQGSTGGDVWVVDAHGGNPIDITPGIDGSPTFEVWLTDHRIGMVEDRRGRILLPDYDVAKRALIPNSVLDLGEINISGGPIKDAVSASTTGALAFVKSGHDAPPELWAGPADHLTQITHLNDATAPHARTESVEWSNEGFQVQGWLTYPANFDPAKKYPIIVQVHGGPSASAGARWGRNLWSELGYFEFDPNPRGSYGQGEKFTAANIKDFGYGDFRDILSGLDAVERKVPAIDHNREALTGWSYGGFMTMFGVTQTQRFKAAVAGAGIADWESYYGENSIDQWMLPFFGKAVYDDQAVYAKSSALTFIHKVKTPTLVIVGDRDGECPAPQSLEFWHALRAEDVKTQLIIYPNEGHGFVDQDHIRDRTERMLQWFTTQMPGEDNHPASEPATQNGATDTQSVAPFLFRRRLSLPLPPSVFASAVVCLRLCRCPFLPLPLPVFACRCLFLPAVACFCLPLPIFALPLPVFASLPLPVLPLPLPCFCLAVALGYPRRALLARAFVKNGALAPEVCLAVAVVCFCRCRCLFGLCRCLFLPSS